MSTCASSSIAKMPSHSSDKSTRVLRKCPCSHSDHVHLSCIDRSWKLLPTNFTSATCQHAIIDVDEHRHLKLILSQVFTHMNLSCTFAAPFLACPRTPSRPCDDAPDKSAFLSPKPRRAATCKTMFCTPCWCRCCCFQQLVFQVSSLVHQDDHWCFYLFLRKVSHCHDPTHAHQLVRSSFFAFLEKFHHLDVQILSLLILFGLIQLSQLVLRTIFHTHFHFPCAQLSRHKLPWSIHKSRLLRSAARHLHAQADGT